jgi:PAS domain S-box-containing protein
MNDSLGQSQLSALLEHAQDIIIVVDEAGTISYVNPAIEQAIGHTPEEMLGENAFDFMHPDDRSRVWSRFRDLLERPGRATERARHRLEHAEGGWRWVESIGSNHSDEALDGFVINVRDVTERRRREQKIARQQALLEAQQESVLDGILVVDEAGTVISYNDQFVELWGVPGEIGEQDDEAVLEWAAGQLANLDDVHERVDGHDETARETTTDEIGTETALDEIELEDGRVFDRYTTPLVGDGGTHYGQLLTFRDVTERVEREAELQRHNERLQEFASVVAHDLRNPLNVATGQLDVARERDDDEHLEAVAESHERIAALIDDLLGLAREGEQVSDATQVDLGSLVESCWRTVETGDATLVAETDRTISADRSRLKQLLENLVRNACEHGGDDVTVTVGELESGFYVEDDGPGIPPDERDLVFDTGYSTAEAGTGVGLSVVRQVAVAHDWDVEVTEGTGGGARFEFTGVTVGAG